MVVTHCSSRDRPGGVTLPPGRCLGVVLATGSRSGNRRAGGLRRQQKAANKRGERGRPSLRLGCRIGGGHSGDPPSLLARMTPEMTRKEKTNFPGFLLTRNEFVEF